MPHGLELPGRDVTWIFETDGIRVRYGTGLRVNGLLRQLGERVVPDRALAGVTVSTGSRRTVLRLQLRPGADPLLEAAAGQLPESADPYRLVLNADQNELAEYYAQLIRDRIALNPEADRPAERFLLPGPPLPRHLKAYDGEGVFDGREVVFRWDWLGARTVKRRAGDQVFPVQRISGVEWAIPGAMSGHLRLRLVDEAGRTVPDPDSDLQALVFGLGFGTLAESLLFAAAVLVAVQQHRGEGRPALEAASGGNPGTAAGAGQIGRAHV